MDKASIGWVRYNSVLIKCLNHGSYYMYYIYIRCSFKVSQILFQFFTVYFLWLKICTDYFLKEIINIIFCAGGAVCFLCIGKNFKYIYINYRLQMATRVLHHRLISNGIPDDEMKFVTYVVLCISQYFDNSKEIITMKWKATRRLNKASPFSQLNNFWFDISLSCRERKCQVCQKENPDFSEAKNSAKVERNILPSEYCLTRTALDCNCTRLIWSELCGKDTFRRTAKLSVYYSHSYVQHHIAQNLLTLEV
jgi:hypothetical protein